jgi:hypothetical protein
MEKKYPIGELIDKLKENIRNHMNPYNLGDEGTRLIFQLIKMAEEQQAPTGAVWVKANVRLPSPENPPVLIPVKRYETDPMQYSVRAMTANQLADIIKWDQATFEWLDERTAVDAVERLRDIQLTDMDAPIFTHTKEFEAHFSYIKGKMIELLGGDKVSTANQSLKLSALTLGPPTATGTYFGVIKPYTCDEQQLCVLHYQAHKNLCRAAGHAFNFVVQAEEVVGYVR